MQRGSSPRTTLLPRLMMPPISSQPARVLSRLSRGVWEAERSSSSPQLNTILPRVCGMPLGVLRTAPSSPASPAL